VISATRSRLVTPAELRDSLAGHPRAPGRRELGVLIGRLAAGCESELELWGHLEVFDVAGLRHGVRQLPIRVGTSRYRLDLAYEQERVAVELDGRAYHASPAQWERDIRRDLALATVGWQTVRLSHRRLTTDVHGCRRDVLAVLAARRPGRRGR
jgi:very-short-patch-repair endonuclease